MKLITPLLLLLFLISNLSISYAAVDIKKKESIEQDSQNDFDIKNQKTNRKWFQKKSNRKLKKNRKFRLRNIFVWNKNKKDESTSKKENPLVLIISQIATVSSIMSIILLAVFTFNLPGFIFISISLGFLIGIVFGIGGLIKIKKNPEKYYGKTAAWFCIFIGFLWFLLTFSVIFYLAF